MAVSGLAACITWSACLFCLVALLTGFVLGDDQKIYSNVNVTAEAGTAVTFSCRPVDNELVVLWTEKFSNGAEKDVAMDCKPINGYANKSKLSCDEEWRNLTILEVSNSTIYRCYDKEAINGHVYQFHLTVTESKKPSFAATTVKQSSSVDNPLNPAPSIDNDASTSMQPAAARNFENQTVNIVLCVLLGLTILGGFGCFLYLCRKIRKYGARHKQQSLTTPAVEVRRHSTPRSDVNQQLERFIPDQRSRAVRASTRAVSEEKLREVLVDNNGVREPRSNIVVPDAVGKKNLQGKDLTLTDVPLELLETIMIKASISLYSRNTFQPDAVTEAESVKLITKICHRWWKVMRRRFLRKQLIQTMRTIPRLVTVIDESSARKTGDFVVVNGQLHSASFSSKEKLVYDANPPFTTICDIIAEDLDIPNEPQRSELTITEHNGSYFVVDFRNGTLRKVDREAMGYADMMTSNSQINLNHDNGQRTQEFEACQINELSKDRLLKADRQRRVVLMDSNFELVKVLLDFKQYTLNDHIVVPWRIHYNKTSHLLFVGSRDNQIHVFNWYNASNTNTKPCALEQ